MISACLSSQIKLSQRWFIKRPLCNKLEALIFAIQGVWEACCFKPLDPHTWRSHHRHGSESQPAAGRWAERNRRCPLQSEHRSMCVCLCVCVCVCVYSICVRGILKWQKDTSCAVQVGGDMKVVWRLTWGRVRAGGTGAAVETRRCVRGRRRPPRRGRGFGGLEGEGGCCCAVSPAWCIYLQGGSRRGVGCDGASTGSVARSPRDAGAAVAGLIVISWENCKMSPIVLANPFYLKCINGLGSARKSWGDTYLKSNI